MREEGQGFAFAVLMLHKYQSAAPDCLQRPLRSRFRQQVSASVGANGWERNDLEALLRLVQDGKIRPVIDTVLPLHEAREGMRLLEERAVIGKVIITP
jgi:NADPH:quinone reductase-like Zn-dependent oxidoreductase